jgi:hypothetical protein
MGDEQETKQEAKYESKFLYVGDHIAFFDTEHNGFMFSQLSGCGHVQAVARPALPARSNHPCTAGPPTRVSRSR